MNGIVVIDKPPGISSAGVVARIKKLLRAEKVGHTGTLDPAATGVLVCCVNQATRLARFLLHGRKTYEAVMTLGVTTDTQDAAGQVLEQRAVPDFSLEELRQALMRHAGEQWQSPPAFSALKQNGVPLYTLARRGQPVSKPPRRVSLYAIRLLSAELPRVRFEVACSAGTYIRTLCADIGRELGCGGHLSRLRRLECHGFTLPQALGLDRFEERVRQGQADECLIPMAQALPELPEIAAGAELIDKIRHGRPLGRADLDPSAPETEGVFYKILDARGALAAVMQAQPGDKPWRYGCVFATAGPP